MELGAFHIPGGKQVAPVPGAAREAHPEHADPGPQVEEAEAELGDQAAPEGQAAQALLPPAMARRPRATEEERSVRSRTEPCDARP